MNQENQKINVSGTISFLHMLTVLFIGLKLTGHIDWHWAWVLVPIWGSIIGVLLLALIAATIAHYVTNR